jgi:hypothetical protein
MQRHREHPSGADLPCDAESEPDRNARGDGNANATPDRHSDAGSKPDRDLRAAREHYADGEARTRTDR